MRNAKIRNFHQIRTWVPGTVHVRFEDLISDGGANAIRWMSDLASTWHLPLAGEELQIHSNNPKHPGQYFNVTAYEAKLFLTRLARNDPAACAMISQADLAFIARESSAPLEMSVGYAIPSTAALCQPPTPPPPPPPAVGGLSALF